MLRCIVLTKKILYPHHFPPSVKLKNLNYINTHLGYPPLKIGCASVGVSFFLHWVGRLLLWAFGGCVPLVAWFWRWSGVLVWSGNWQGGGCCGRGCFFVCLWNFVATFGKNNPFFVATFQILSLTLQLQFKIWQKANQLELDLTQKSWN